MSKKIKTIKIPNCPGCKKQMEMRFTTEQEEDSKKKPEILICFGVCHKCSKIVVCDLVKTKDLPGNFKELKKAIKEQSAQEKN